MPIQINRTGTILKPDQSRVLLRPFNPGDAERSGRIIARIMSLPEDRVGPLLERSRSPSFPAAPANSQSLPRTLRTGPRPDADRTRSLSEQRRLLIGSYFLAEYSLESAALFNPSIVPHRPDRPAPGALRFHSQPARHRGRTHFFHHVSNRCHSSRPADRSTDPTGFLTEPRQIPKPLHTRRHCSRENSRAGIGRRIHAPRHG